MTIKDLMQKLGGAANVARELGIPYTTVAEWQQVNRVPSWRVEKLAALARERRVKLPKALAVRKAA